MVPDDSTVLLGCRGMGVGLQGSQMLVGVQGKLPIPQAGVFQEGRKNTGLAQPTFLLRGTASLQRPGFTMSGPLHRRRCAIDLKTTLAKTQLTVSPKRGCWPPTHIPKGP